MLMQMQRFEAYNVKFEVSTLTNGSCEWKRHGSSYNAKRTKFVTK